MQRILKYRVIPCIVAIVIFCVPFSLTASAERYSWTSTAQPINLYASRSCLCEDGVYRTLWDIDYCKQWGSYVYYSPVIKNSFRYRNLSKNYTGRFGSVWYSSSSEAANWGEDSTCQYRCSNSSPIYLTPGKKYTFYIRYTLNTVASDLESFHLGIMGFTPHNGLQIPLYKKGLESASGSEFSGISISKNYYTSYCDFTYSLDSSRIDSFMFIFNEGNHSCVKGRTCFDIYILEFGISEYLSVNPAAGANDEIDEASDYMEKSQNAALGGKSDDQIQDELGEAIDFDFGSIDSSGQSKLNSFITKLSTVFGKQYMACILLSCTLGLGCFIIGRRYSSRR